MTKSIRVELDDDLHRKARIKSAKTGIPMTEICRKALEEWTKDIKLDAEHTDKR